MQQNIKVLKRIGRICVGLALLISVSLAVNAQTPADTPGGPGGGGGGDQGIPDGPVVPLDRDMSIALLAAGVAYGFSTFTKSKSRVILGFQ
ncbi:hypothetical protein [Parasediminibacterium sp. JCM 36343]|uniref:hypothetical protein n=1 Tax=Parasediminibacterium sp. JCM 36343 TaxID=3374279 RepID=UPI003978A369